MKINKQTEFLLKKYIADEISTAELKMLQKEALQNKEIADLLELHNTLADPKFAFEEADTKAFEKMRSITLNSIHRYENRKKPLQWLFTLPSIHELFYRPAFTAAFSIIMFVMGVLLSGYFTKDDLLQDITKIAASTQDIQNSVNSPYIYSNAKFREQKDGVVSVSFDVSRHLEIEGTKEDPLVQEILAQSLLNTESSQQRLQNIENTEQIMHPKIKQALILTMLNDSNPVVRQKSMLSLMKYANDKEIQDALLTVLNKEESVYMRLAAIDYLSNNISDKSQLERKLTGLNPQNNSAIDQRIKQLKY